MCGSEVRSSEARQGSRRHPIRLCAVHAWVQSTCVESRTGTTLRMALRSSPPRPYRVRQGVVWMGRNAKDGENGCLEAARMSTGVVVADAADSAEKGRVA